MTEYVTSHYDIDHEQRGKTLLVLESFKMMAEGLDNEIIPSSRVDNIMTGIENPASTLHSTGNHYTTIPLRPLSEDVNFLPNNYINHDFQIKFTITPSIATTSDQDFAVYFPSTTVIPSRVQLLVGNTTIWQNQFQRAEGMAALSSIPQEIVANSNEYVTMSKLLKREPIPGVYVTLPAGSAQDTANGFDCRFSFNIDMNHFTPILSNIPFVTTQMGDLRLRIFYENLEQALCITPLPANNSTIVMPDTTKPNEWTIKTSNTNFRVLEKLPINKDIIMNTSTTMINTQNAQTVYTITPGVPITYKTSFTSWKANNFGVQIVQSNFKLKEGGMDMIKSFISSKNKLIIPTQTWSTCLATSVPSGKTTQELIFQVSAYNIYLLAFLFPYKSIYQTYYPNTKMENIDIMINSKSITYIPYSYIDERVIKDTAQAFLNDDKYGINENLLNSLILEPYNGTPYDANTYKAVYSNTDGPLIYRPNNCLIAKGLSPPNSFEKGMCVASQNPQSTQIRFKYSLGTDIDAGIAQMNPGPLWNTDFQPYCLALQDCCIVLNYNANVGVCQSGSIVYAEPFKVEMQR